jgi:hypothetical protein
MGLAFLLLALLLASKALSEWLWRRGRAPSPGPVESACSVGLIFMALWIASNWILAWLHLLTAGGVLLCAAVLFVSGAAGLWRMRHLDDRPSDERSVSARVIAIVCGLPLALWVVFSLWKGFWAPVCQFDAFAYHMPKAVMLMNHGGYGYFDAPDPRIPASPANFELLLSNFLMLTGSDRTTEWLGTLTFVLFVIAAAAQAERWWRPGTHTAVAALAAACVPVVLLHSSTQKNDLMMAFFSISAFVWSSRFVSEGSIPSALLAIVAIFAAVGTKVTGLGLVASVGPILVWGLVRHQRSGAGRTLRLFGALAVMTVCSFGLLGGTAYVVNVIHSGSLFGPSDIAPMHVGYGDWSNLWKFPVLVLLSPFSPVANGVYVPWKGEYWFWHQYELYFSNFGVLTTVCFVSLPLAAWLCWKRLRPNGREVERIAATIGSVLTLAILLPQHTRPLGLFCGFPRFLMFVPVTIAGWTLVPFIRVLISGRAVARTSAALITVAVSAWFVLEAREYATFDRFAPFLNVLRHAYGNPVPLNGFMYGRSAILVDEIAGPFDEIAVEGGFDCWVYPAYGERLTRKVTFVGRAGGEPVVSPTASWVIVDRSFNHAWGSPQLTDMGKFWSFINKGTLSAEDTLVVRRLLADPIHYQVVFWNPDGNQAIFRRIPASSR